MKDVKMQNLIEELTYLKLNFIAENLDDLIRQKKETHLDFLEAIIHAEFVQKQQKATERRIRAARIPVIKTLDSFNFAHPETIEPEKRRMLFRLNFIERKENVIIFCGGVGLGKTHLASALAMEACRTGYTTLFTSAVDIVNSLKAARHNNKLTQVMRKYTRPQLLIIDELGYMPVDKEACDLLFQVVSNRYERRSIVITTNRPYKDWPIIFNNDATVTSAILDRLLHHVETIKIEGRSYRMTGK